MNKNNEFYKSIRVSEYVDLIKNVIRISNDAISLVRTFKMIHFNVSGYILYDLRIGLSVFELPDEWFIVKIKGNIYLCDQLDGLKKNLNYLCRYIAHPHH